MGEWTKERIEAAEKRCEKATIGPWWRGDTDDNPAGEGDCVYVGERDVIAAELPSEDDATFIAHARTDLPDALAEIKAAAVALDAEISRSDKAADRPYSLAERIEFVITGLRREARRGDCAEDEVKRLTLRIQGLEQANYEACALIKRARVHLVDTPDSNALDAEIMAFLRQGGLAGLRSVVADKAAQVSEDVIGQALTVASGAQAVESVAVANRETRLHALFEKFMPMLLEEQTMVELGITCPCGATATDYTVDGLDSKPVCADFPRCKSRTTDEHVGHRIPTVSQAVIGAHEPADLARRFDRAYLDALGKDPDDATDEDAHRARAKALGTLDRESLGRMVREAWVLWAREQPNPKDSWLVPWEGLSEPDKEVDRRIGETIAGHARAVLASRPGLSEAHEVLRSTLEGLHGLMPKDAFDALHEAVRDVENARTGLTEGEARAWERLTAAIVAVSNVNVDERFPELRAAFAEYRASRSETGPTK